MAFLTKIRSKTLIKFRNYCTSSPSSILAGDPKIILTSKEKSRAALNLLKSETNPEKILNICRAAALTPESKLDRLAFSTAVSKLAKMNYFEGIRTFLEGLKRRPDLRYERFIAHSIVLYGQAGMIRNGITSFEQMERMGIPRTVKSFNALLFACVLAKECDEAKRIFTDFPTMYNIEPDVTSYNTLIQAFCEAGESSSGYSTIAEMGRKKCKPNATTFTNMIAGFYREQKFEDVGKVLQLMREHNVKLGLSTYNVRIDGLCRIGRSFEAKALLDCMVERGMKPNVNTYSSLIQGFCKEGKFDDAKKLFKDMVERRVEPSSECYFTLTYFLCQGGDYETALEICKQSIKNNWVPNFTTMKSLVEGLVSVSKLDEAKELVEQIKTQFPKSADRWKETEAKLSK